VPVSSRRADENKVREIVTFRVALDMSVEQIAKVTRLRPRTVRKVLKAAGLNVNEERTNNEGGSK